MRIAIIGTGISGLVAAHHLHREHELTLFESSSHIGGHTHTHDIAIDSESHAIDTGFIVFNETNYPRFCELLDELNVPSQPTSMSFSVRCDRSSLEYNGSSLNQIFTQRRNLFRPSFHRMLRDIARFNRQASVMAADSFESDGIDDRLSVADFAQGHHYGEMFVEKYLIPLGASLWSCPPKVFRDFPIRFVVEFLHNHAMLQYAGRPVWRTVRGGSRQYVLPLVRPFRDHIHLNCAVQGVRRGDEEVQVATAQGDTASFDHVIFACHADTALRLLHDATPTERELLSAFPYQRNVAILHTDTRVLPRARRAWASWNYRVSAAESDHVAVTYNMNLLQNLESRHMFCVTLNDDSEIDPSRILRRIEYHHPIYTAQRASAQRRHDEVLGVNRTSFCGAYWGYGFHEDGVRSGLRVVESLRESRHQEHAICA